MLNGWPVRIVGVEIKFSDFFILLLLPRRCQGIARAQYRRHFAVSHTNKNTKNGTESSHNYNALFEFLISKEKNVRAFLQTSKFYCFARASFLSVSIKFCAFLTGNGFPFFPPFSINSFAHSVRHFTFSLLTSVIVLVTKGNPSRSR